MFLAIVDNQSLGIFDVFIGARRGKWIKIKLLSRCAFNGTPTLHVFTSDTACQWQSFVPPSGVLET